MPRIRRGPSTNICTTPVIAGKPGKTADAMESEYYQHDEEWSNAGLNNHRVTYQDLRREIDEVKARNNKKTSMECEQEKLRSQLHSNYNLTLRSKIDGYASTP